MSNPITAQLGYVTETFPDPKGLSDHRYSAVSYGGEVGLRSIEAINLACPVAKPTTTVGAVGVVTVPAPIGSACILQLDGDVIRLYVFGEQIVFKACETPPEGAQ